MGITKEWYTIGDVANHFKVSTQSIRHWANIGEIPQAVRSEGNNRRVYSEQDIEVIQRYIDSK